MFTAKFIKNIIFDGERLRAIGRSGSSGVVINASESFSTRVFAEQGDLDGSCAVYSLLMMLIFHKKLDWKDLTDECAKDNDFVDRIQRLFLYSFKSLCRGGHTFDDLIRAQLDARKPVQIGFFRKSGLGHSVVAVAYRREE